MKPTREYTVRDTYCARVKGCKQQNVLKETQKWWHHSKNPLRFVQFSSVERATTKKPEFLLSAIRSDNQYAVVIESVQEFYARYKETCYVVFYVYDAQRLELFVLGAIHPYNLYQHASKRGQQNNVFIQDFVMPMKEAMTYHNPELHRPVFATTSAIATAATAAVVSASSDSRSSSTSSTNSSVDYLLAGHGNFLAGNFALLHLGHLTTMAIAHLSIPLRWMQIQRGSSDNSNNNDSQLSSIPSPPPPKPYLFTGTDASATTTTTSRKNKRRNSNNNCDEAASASTASAASVAKSKLLTLTVPEKQRSNSDPDASAASILSELLEWRISLYRLVNSLWRSMVSESYETTLYTQFFPRVTEYLLSEASVGLALRVASTTTPQQQEEEADFRAFHLASDAGRRLDSLSFSASLLVASQNAEFLQQMRLSETLLTLYKMDCLYSRERDMFLLLPPEFRKARLNSYVSLESNNNCWYGQHYAARQLPSKSLSVPAIEWVSAESLCHELLVTAATAATAATAVSTGGSASSNKSIEKLMGPVCVSRGVAQIFYPQFSWWMAAQTVHNIESYCRRRARASLSLLYQESRCLQHSSSNNSIARLYERLPRLSALNSRLAMNNARDKCCGVEEFLQLSEYTLLPELTFRVARHYSPTTSMRVYQQQHNQDPKDPCAVEAAASSSSVLAVADYQILQEYRYLADRTDWYQRQFKEHQQHQQHQQHEEQDQHPLQELDVSLEETFHMFPPCIRNLIDTACNVRHLKHEERRTLIWFLCECRAPRGTNYGRNNPDDDVQDESKDYEIKQEQQQQQEEDDDVYQEEEEEDDDEEEDDNNNSNSSSSRYKRRRVKLEYDSNAASEATTEQQQEEPELTPLQEIIMQTNQPLFSTYQIQRFWKRLCDMQTSTTNSAGLSLQEFLERNEYGRICAQLIEFYRRQLCVKRSESNGGGGGGAVENDTFYISGPSFSCNTLIAQHEFCPFAEHVSSRRGGGSSSNSNTARILAKSSLEQTLSYDTAYVVRRREELAEALQQQQQNDNDKDVYMSTSTTIKCEDPKQEEQQHHKEEVDIEDLLDTLTSCCSGTGTGGGVGRDYQVCTSACSQSLRYKFPALRAEYTQVQHPNQYVKTGFIGISMQRYHDNLELSLQQQ